MVKVTDLKKFKKDSLQSMFQDIDSVNVDEIKNTGITIRAGNKLVKLSVVSESPIHIEDEIREEFRLRLREKLQEIKNRLDKKVTEIVETTSRIRIEAERKEQELKNQLKLAHPMPDVFVEHAERGISVVKGHNRDELIWLINGIYWPKFYDGKRIEPKYSKKLVTQIIFMIKTRGNKIYEVTTRKLNGLGYFDHYHQQKPDCWGYWKYPPTFETPDDLLKIAREAEAVLENVNPHSIAQRAPRGLPRKQTLQRHILTDPAKDVEPKRKQTDIRVGERVSEDIWEI